MIQVLFLQCNIINPISLMVKSFPLYTVPVNQNHPSFQLLPIWPMTSSCGILFFLEFFFLTAALFAYNLYTINFTYCKCDVVQLFSHVLLFATSWTTAHQTSLSFTIFQSLLKLMSIESMMPSNHLIFCCPLLLLPSIFPSIRVFFSESALHIRWPK